MQIQEHEKLLEQLKEQARRQKEEMDEIEEEEQEKHKARMEEEDDTPCHPFSVQMPAPRVCSKRETPARGRRLRW